MSEQTILVVSSDSLLVDSVQNGIEGTPYRLAIVGKGPDAIDYLKSFPAALVVVDQELSDAAGLDLLQEAMRAKPFAVRILAVPEDEDPNIYVQGLNTARVSFFIQKQRSCTVDVRDILGSAVASYETEAQSRTAVEILHQSMFEKVSGFGRKSHQLRRLCTAGEMAGSLIHKFNNTLTLIMGHLEMLLSDVKDAEIINRLNPIFQSAADSAGMARRLQEFMRTSPDEMEPIDLNKLILDTLKMTEPVWKSGSRGHTGDIKLETDLSELTQVSGNPSEMREALTNLVLNAVDAMPQGGELTISSFEMTNWIRIEIQDTGVGMSAHVKDRIFEPFFTTKGENGNGLGLSIVRRIVQEHGGDVRIESQAGKGSRFILLLPLSGPAIDSPLHPAAPNFQIAG